MSIDKYLPTFFGANALLRHRQKLEEYSPLQRR